MGNEYAVNVLETELRTVNSRIEDTVAYIEEDEKRIVNLKEFLVRLESQKVELLTIIETLKGE